MTEAKKTIKNKREDHKVSRCGHNFKIEDCPYRYCSAKSLLSTARAIDRQLVRTGGVRPDVHHSLRMAILMAKAAIEPKEDLKVSA